MKKLLLFLLMSLLPMVASAYDANIDGIYYNLDNVKKTAEVTAGYWGSDNKYAYSGTVNIPSAVSYNGDLYTVTGIESGAFSYCSELSFISIPNSVSSIGYYAFLETGWYNAQPDGIIYLDNWLIGYKGEKPTGNFLIEEGTRGIAGGAFSECDGLTSISIPNSVIGIGKRAFTECSNLTSVTLPNNLKIIEEGTFSRCISLTSITIPDGVTSIEGGSDDYNRGAFAGCISLSSVKIPNSVTNIGDIVFLDCSSLTSIAIPNSVTSIGCRAFQGCSSLTSVTIPTSMTIIEEGTFSDCSNLTSISIPNNITSIGVSAFSDCNSLTSVTIPNSVTSIGRSAFYKCSGLKSVTIPNSVASIEVNTFSSCSGLTSITIPNSVTSIGIGAFGNCIGLTAINIPNSVTSIEADAFIGCSALSSVTIPNSVTSIGVYAFESCNKINSVYISDLSAWCSLFSTNTSDPIFFNNFHLYLNDKEIEELIIPENVTSLGNFAFYGCSYITSVSIPNNVTIVGESAFEKCSGIKTLKLSDKLQIIKKAAFKECNSMKTVTIPAIVEFIYQEAFANCNELERVNALPTTPPFIYDNSFSNFSVLLKVPKGYKETYQIAQGWKNFTNISDADNYILTYVVDGEEYNSYEIEYGLKISPEEEPTKEGYTFSGWSEIPETMPAHDVIVTGSFSKNEKVKETISIGGKGKTTYCGDLPLDFSSFEDLKAYVATGYEGDGTTWLTRVKQVPANTPILIKGEANQTYEVPVMDKCDAYFENMFKGSADENLIISTTTEDGKFKNFYMSEGKFKPASASQKINAGKAYLQVPANFNPAKAGEDQTVKIADSGKSSYAPPVDIDLTDVEGLKAYAATGYDAANSTIWLTRINKIQAGEGVLLKGEAGKEYTLPSAEVQAYYGNMFVGNIDEKITINETSDDGVWTNYYLASGSFKKVSGSREIGTNKSYLHLPTSLLVSSARGKQNADIDEWFMEELETDTLLLGSIGGDDEDGTTRIDAISNDNTQPDVYYNLQGQRVDNPKKGLYIHNGRKVVVK